MTNQPMSVLWISGLCAPVASLLSPLSFVRMRQRAEPPRESILARRVAVFDTLDRVLAFVHLLICAHTVRSRGAPEDKLRLLRDLAARKERRYIKQ